MPAILLDTFLKTAAGPDLGKVIFTIARAGKYVAHALRNGDLGKSGLENPSGENQLALDILADKIFCDHLRSTGLVAVFASEEQNGEVAVSPDGKFSVAFDPLDGSSLVDSNLAIGAIFAIYRGAGFLGKTGREMAAAGYLIFGPRTKFVFATENGIWEFTENAIGEFTLSKEKIELLPDAKIFAPGNLRALAERPEYEKLFLELAKTPLTLRYSGGMVPDIHLAFSKSSGIFLYPSHSKYPNGKLRLLYECAVFAFLAKAAGGAALDENGAEILDKKITKLHERTTFIVGSKNTVFRAVEILRGEK